MKDFLVEFWCFGMKQLRACVFAGSFFVVLYLSHVIDVGIPRYDFIFLAAVLIQIVLVLTKIETIDEVKVILLFHVIGFALEVFKTHPSIGSWSYPEFGYVKLFNVPLYSGFMYAAVGSYIAQAWRIFNLKLVRPPSYWLSSSLCLAIYLNFFWHHFWIDLRYWLMAAVLMVFSRTWVEYTPLKKVRRMPMVLSFFLIAFFIWIAENMATFLGAWKYPDQILTWTTVSLHKIGSWSLLVIISFMIVASLKHYKAIRLPKTP